MINADDAARAARRSSCPELAGRELRVVPWRPSAAPAAPSAPTALTRVSDDGWVTLDLAARDGVLLDAL